MKRCREIGVALALATVFVIGGAVQNVGAATFCGAMDSVVTVGTFPGGQYAVRRLTMDLSGCTAGMAFGAATGCTRAPMGSTSASKFTALAGTGFTPTSGDFCTHMCAGPGGPCTVKTRLSDGLPVELLGFGVE